LILIFKVKLDSEKPIFFQALKDLRETLALRAESLQSGETVRVLIPPRLAGPLGDSRLPG